jgi:hypothetical protein
MPFSLSSIDSFSALIRKNVQHAYKKNAAAKAGRKGFKYKLYTVNIKTREMLSGKKYGWETLVR